MAAKKKSTTKSSPAVTHYNESYEALIRKEGNNLFSKRFSTHLINELIKVSNLKKTTNIMKCLTQGVKIINKEVFYSFFKIGIGDLGHEAWRTAEDDILKFAYKVVGLMELHRGRGESEIDLSSVLFYLSYFKGYMDSDNKKWKFNQAAKTIAAATIGAKFNPYLIQIAHPRFVADIGEALGLPNSFFYRSAVRAFFEVYEDFYEKTLCKTSSPSMTFPKIRFIIPIERRTRESQIVYLARLFNEKIKDVKELVEGIEDLGIMSEDLSIVLDKLIQKKEWYKGINRNQVVKELAQISKTGQYYSIQELKDYHRYLCDGYDSKLNSLNCYKRYNVEDSYIEKDSFLNNPFNEVMRIEVDCDKYEDKDEIEPLVLSAAEILMTRVRKKPTNGADFMIKEDGSSKLLIILKNVKMFNNIFAVWVKGLEKRLCSLYNQTFCINIHFDPTTVTSRFCVATPEYVRVISDIHCDVNRDKNYLYDFGNDFVINCGDTGSNADEEFGWVRSFVKQGVNVSGNHLGYTSFIPELDGIQNYEEWGSYISPKNTKNNQLAVLEERAQGTYTPFLSNVMTEREGMIFIGNILYTDFKLFGEKNQVPCMLEASQKMNDFKLCTVLKRKDNDKTKWEVAPFTVDEHLRLFKVCLGYIKNRLNNLRSRKNKKPIIIVTHHAPLPFCISKKYKNDPLSAAFASDLRWFIKEFPEIRLWCSGHVHEPYDFVYNETRFVCEPWGYFNENNFDIEKYGKRIPIADIKNVAKKWRTILKDKIKRGRVKDYGYCEEL